MRGSSTQRINKEFVIRCIAHVWVVQYLLSPFLA